MQSIYPQPPRGLLFSGPVRFVFTSGLTARVFPGAGEAGGGSGTGSFPRASEWRQDGAQHALGPLPHSPPAWTDRREATQGLLVPGTVLGAPPPMRSRPCPLVPSPQQPGPTLQPAQSAQQPCPPAQPSAFSGRNVVFPDPPPATSPSSHRAGPGRAAGQQPLCVQTPVAWLC